MHQSRPPPDSAVLFDAKMPGTERHIDMKEGERSLNQDER
jgi:hypothetical protein